jgi:hypothetical protein
VIGDDAIIAVRINTNDNGINNNYNNNTIKARVSVEGEAGEEWTWGRGCKQQRLTDGRCVLFKMRKQGQRTITVFYSSTAQL